MLGSQEPHPPLRADARRNREQIIEAARMLFVRWGPDVPMEEIARAAGVGVGTLYRRFPDRDELIKAVSLDNFERLRGLARHIEDEEPDPATALGKLLYSSLDLRLGVMLTAISPRSFAAMRDSPAISAMRTEVVEVTGRLLRRAQAAGTMRTDIDGGDVVLAMVLLARLIPPSDREFDEMVFRRLVTLMLDGLRASPGSPLPGRPVTYADVEELRATGAFSTFGRPANA